MNVENKKQDENSDSNQKSIHPICLLSPTPEKCQELVDRLTDASNNIDRYGQ